MNEKDADPGSMDDTAVLRSGDASRPGRLAETGVNKSSGDHYFGDNAARGGPVAELADGVFPPAVHIAGGLNGATRTALVAGEACTAPSTPLPPTPRTAFGKELYPEEAYPQQSSEEEVSTAQMPAPLDAPTSATRVLTFPRVPFPPMPKPGSTEKHWAIVHTALNQTGWS